MARRASLRQLDAEVRGTLRNAGIDPRRATVVLHAPLDREHARNSRRYAQVVPEDMHFEFATATLDLDAAHRRALVAHEVGHVIEHRRKGEHTEADADRAAERVLGVPICYDRRWPGKGLQVDCRVRVNDTGGAMANSKRKPNGRVRAVNPSKERQWVRVPSAWLRKGMIVQAPKWVVDDEIRKSWGKFWGANPPKTLRVHHWDDDSGESLLVEISRDGSKGEGSVDANTGDYPDQFLVDIDSIDADAETRRDALRQGHYPPDAGNPSRGSRARRNPKAEIFTHAEGAAIIDRVVTCATSVAENMGVDAKIREYYDNDRPESDTLTFQFNFVPRVPTQRHLTLAENPKGISAKQAESIREEYENCVGRFAESNRLMVSYNNGRPTPKGIPIRLKITRRSAQQSDLFGNPSFPYVIRENGRELASGEIKAKSLAEAIHAAWSQNVRGSLSSWDFTADGIVGRGSGPVRSTTIEVDQTRTKRKSKTRRRNVAWMEAGRVYRQQFAPNESLWFVAQQQLKNGGWKGIEIGDYGTHRKAKQSSVPKSSMALWREVGPDSVPAPQRRALAERGAFSNPSRATKPKHPHADVEDTRTFEDRGWTPHGDHLFATGPHRDGWYAMVEAPMDRPGVTDEWGPFDSHHEAASAAREAIDRWDGHAPSGEDRHVDGYDENPKRRNPYMGDAVEKAKKRKQKQQREKWEREGRRGPLPAPSSTRARRISNRIANGGC